MKNLSDIEKEAIKLVKIYKHRRDCGDFVPSAHNEVVYQMNSLESAVDIAMTENKAVRLLKKRATHKAGYWKRKFDKGKS